MQQDYELHQITGLVEDVVYQNENNSFTVIDVSSKGELITAVGVLPEITAGEKVVLTGRWDVHHSFGRQFKIERFERYMPDTAAQFLKYLSSGAIKGIGPKTAAQLVERFGDNTFHVIESQPERMTVIRGISADKANMISAEFKKQNSVRAVILGLERYGLSPSECIKIFKKIGINAVEIVEQNPYILCGDAGIITFERAEKIASELPEKPQSKHRCRAGITYIIKHNLSNGHTCLPRKKVVPLCQELLGISEDDAREAIDEMLTNKLLMSYTIGDKEFLCLCEAYEAEREITEKIKLLCKFSARDLHAADNEIDAIERENNIKYEKLQREAIKLSASGGMLVLTGGPGTGKTTAVKGIIKYFERKKSEILLAAPTGRAAKRMSELTGYDAKTIHRLLEVEWGDGDNPTFKRNVQNPLEADVIILDEVSMVDIFLFSNLLNAVRFGSRVILVGDSDQLPAVGAGNVLSDIIDSGIVPVVRLTEVFRQAKQSLIVTNAHGVIEGGEIILDSHDNDFFFMQRESPLNAAETVETLCAKRLPKAYGYSAIGDIQVLCPSRKGDCGTVNLNRRLQAALNPPAKDKTEHKIGLRLFRTGDKVMQIKNNYDIPWERGRESGAGLFNGDIGIIKEINVKNEIMLLEFDDGKQVSYPMSYANELELAYAVTVHKSQGSEYDAVVMPIIDAPPKLRYRNLLYTAITRAKKLMIIVGSRDRLYQMIANNRQNKRYSMLKNMLTDKNMEEFK
ncbi:MAG: ATP-dependent RecD-like DNA helicase [Clostridiales bacterium]|nr:ATP-dependent RecD-like DNA helicase [Clostridiales bacterium]